MLEVLLFKPIRVNSHLIFMRSARKPVLGVCHQVRLKTACSRVFEIRANSKLIWDTLNSEYRPIIHSTKLQETLVNPCSTVNPNDNENMIPLYTKQCQTCARQHNRKDTDHNVQSLSQNPLYNLHRAYPLS